MKKRIGVIMYQTSRSKGQELVAQRMVAYFNKLGDEAHLITSIFHDGKEVISEEAIGAKGYVDVEDVELGIPIIRVAGFVSRWPPRRIAFKDMVHTLESIVNEFGLNVLITHSTLWNGPEEVAKFVEWRRNIKNLGGYQDPIVFCHMSHFQEPSPRRYSLVERSFRLAWNRLALQQVLRVANLTLVVTPFEEEAKVKMGVPREKCVLFPGGVDDESFMRYASSDAQELLRRLNLGSETRIVTYLGTIEERKNPMAVLSLAERMQNRTDVRFVIAGRGDSEYAVEVRRRAHELPNVAYLGEVNEKEKVQLIKGSYLNIILSRMEALGLAQLEFMFQGVPIITSAVGGQSWLIRNGEEGVYVKGPKDLGGAEKAIVGLVEDLSKRERLSTNAIERASAFTLSNLISNLDRVITRELEKETGLSILPPEVRSTLLEPELVVRSWSHGAQKVVATHDRVFIQRGRSSRSTLEIPYTSIRSIEHVRRYKWRTLGIGLALSAVLFAQHFLFPIISRTITSALVNLFVRFIPDAELIFARILIGVLLLPVFIGIVLFALGARKGYLLHGPTLNPTYLPQSFGDAIKYIRSIEDARSSTRERDSEVKPENQDSIQE